MAMTFGIEYFDYYLRGRKFTVETDHTAIKAMKTKADFGNVKLGRMRIRIQEYNFDIVYKPGSENVDADVISRINEKPKEKKMKENIKIAEDGSMRWKISETEYKKFPKVCERDKLIRNIHTTTTNHGGRDAITYMLEKEYYWPKMQDSMVRVIKECEECARNAIKTNGGERFIATTCSLEIVAADIFTVNQETYVLTAEDYYTRKIRLRKLKNKTAIEVRMTLKEIFVEMGKPEKLVIDNGTGFTDRITEEWLKAENISHHRTAADKHESNGRIERVHREIRQAIRKNKNRKMISTIIKEFESKFNRTLHRGIERSPNEAWENPNDKTLKELNGSEGKYAKESKELYRDKLEEDDMIAVKQQKILGAEKVQIFSI